MNDKGINQYILSDTIEKVINKRKVKAAVFLTFRFDPGFFEEEVLPLFFDSSFSHNEKVRLIQLEDLLRGIEHIVVYYDRRGIFPYAHPSRLDYKRIGLKRNTGFFHPKNIFILVENEDEEYEWDSLITVTMSANLTRAGWWENVEVVHIDEIRYSEKCSYRGDLLELIKLIRKEDRTNDESEALEIIRKFLVYQLDEFSWSKKDGRWLQRIHYGQYDLPSFLFDFVKELGECNLEIISPYFDESDNATTLNKLLEWTSPKEVRVFIPEDKDGTYLCKKEFFEAVKNLPRVKWAKLPSDVTRRSETVKNIDDRTVHAKVYRFWSQSVGREMFFIGSLNLTNAAHQSVKGGNFETGILIEPEVNGKLVWWLTPVEDEKGRSFRTEKDEVSDADDVITNLSMKFDWNSDTSYYFWESDSIDQIDSVKVCNQGIYLFNISSIVFNRWNKLPKEFSMKLKEILPSTSFIEIRLKDGRSQKILVREEGMAKKPSIINNLTVEEILKYWSLLSPEQKEFLLQKKVAEKFGLSEYLSEASKERAPESMFDKFAGIFHAFGRLKSHIIDAVENERFNEARYRLLGEKYDSLPTLIDKVLEDKSSDQVNKYLTLLCAQQLVAQFEKSEKYYEFKKANLEDFKMIKKKLQVVKEIRDFFEFDSIVERDRFFDWFEEMFMMEIPVQEENN